MLHVKVSKYETSIFYLFILTYLACLASRKGNLEAHRWFISAGSFKVYFKYLIYDQRRAGGRERAMAVLPFKRLSSETRTMQSVFILTPGFSEVRAKVYSVCLCTLKVVL